MLMFQAVANPDLGAPKKISGIQRWMNAENTTQESGGRVITFTDLSGNSRNYTAASASTARPTYTTNVFNGRPALTFDGTANILDGGTNKDLVNTAAYTAIVVFQRDAFPGTASYFEQILNLRTDSASFSANLILLDLYVAYSSKQVMVGFGGSTLMGVASATTAGTNYIAYNEYIGGTKTTVGNFNLALNSSSQTLTATTNWTVQDVNKIGAYNNGGSPSGFFKGKIAEVVIYNKNLSTAEKTSLRIYFQRKYNTVI